MFSLIPSDANDPQELMRRSHQTNKQTISCLSICRLSQFLCRLCMLICAFAVLTYLTCDSYSIINMNSPAEIKIPMFYLH